MKRSASLSTKEKSHQEEQGDFTVTPRGSAALAHLRSRLGVASSFVALVLLRRWIALFTKPLLLPALELPLRVRPR